jgi:thiol:disulfide interchange protein DsbD
VRLVADAPRLAPGTEHQIGVVFDLEPGWHLYWNGQNDTGYPIRVEADFPEGIEAGDLLWPVPRRLVSPGGILDHVYSNRVTLLVPVRVDSALAGHQRVVLRVRAAWMACADVCVPGEGEARLDVGVGGGGSGVSPGAELLAEARSRLPRSAPAPVDARWEDGRLEIRSRTAGFLAFFPDTASAPLHHLLTDGVSTDGRLLLRPREDSGSTQVSGVLAVGEGTPPDTVYFSFRVPLPMPARKDTP